MIRKAMFGLALAAVSGLTIGCDTGTKDSAKNDKAKEGAEKAKEMREKGKDVMKDGMDKAGDMAKAGADKEAEALRSETLKPITEKLEAIKGKLGGLTGDAGTKAKTAFDELNKLVEGFKAAPLDKIKDLVKPLQDKFAEVMKMVG